VLPALVTTGERQCAALLCGLGVWRCPGVAVGRPAQCPVAACVFALLHEALADNDTVTACELPG
jgi:hypothetical protein